MEVLPCSGVQCVGESDRTQESSGTDFVYDGESNGFGNGKQVADSRAHDSLLNVEGHQVGRESKGQGTVDELPLSEGHHSGASYSDCQMESQKLSCDSHDSEDDDLNIVNSGAEPCAASENSHLVLDTVDSEPYDFRDGESSLSLPKWLEDDESVAMWVKWRGKWQAGIRCARADWPLSTLKAKPTHDRKKYFVIFFPHTRNYSWADMLLVRSINEFPQPIAYKTYKTGLKIVKDLGIARRFIMQKLAVGMLNIVDQFHTEALIDTARNVAVWKDFAMEASRCSGYSDLGRMLLKLQSMILQRYINVDWLQHSFHSWVQSCQAANSAESIELLREELYASILWDDVNSLWNAPVEPTLGSEWKTWKHEVMKWFSTSHPISRVGDVEQQNCDSPNTSLQVSQKRPKLEVRRAETHVSQGETSSPLQAMTVEIDTDFFSNQDSLNAATLASGPSREEEFRDGAAPVESPCSVADRWDEIVVDAANTELKQPKDVEMTPVNEVVVKKTIDPGNKNRQCMAFIQSKGRQCVRWANDGDVYCCVHMASRFLNNSTKAEASLPVHSAMCKGTTVLGTLCKHRSLPGSSFCKKHRSQTDTEETSYSVENTKTLKRKHEEIIPSSEISTCKDIVLMEEVESPLHVEPVSAMDGIGDAFHGRNSSIEKLDLSSRAYGDAELQHCFGSRDDGGPCRESPKRYSLYCDKHIPSWLKRARNGKSRIISKEVFIDLLQECRSPEQKLHLHQACELFYKFFKSVLSLRNLAPMEVQLQWAMSEASKDFNVGVFLLKLVCTEKDRLIKIWDFSADRDVQTPSSIMEESTALPLAIECSHGDETSIKCKICSEGFLDDQELGNHWLDNHKKEAQWLFRGHACAICLDSFTNKKGLETHVQERHHVQFVEQCMLLQCIPCGSHFGNTEQLWMHVLSAHPVNFRQSKAPLQLNLSTGEEKKDSLQKVEVVNAASIKNNEKSEGIRKFICRFCGLKFDLLPDLGRHHQAAHMGPNLFSSHPAKKSVRYYAYRLKSGRLGHPRFKKGLGAATYRMRNRGGANMKKQNQVAKSLSTGRLSIQPQVTQAAALSILAESQCSSVAKILFAEIQKTKPRPNNYDILSIARSACCKVSLKASLEGKYGVLPERVYLKAAKLCSEHNIQVQWHQERFICPRGCRSFKDPGVLSPLMPLPNGFRGKQLENSLDLINNEWEVDECHYVIDFNDLREGPKRKTTVLCSDISFGKESVPVVCLVEEDVLDAGHVIADGSVGQVSKSPMPWESFTYVTKPLLDDSHNPDIESLQLGCACPNSVCIPETCDHVYLFDNDYEDARDVYGKPMHVRFPYDDKGRIMLEEGYLVYECNQWCCCNSTCPNRVLQNGVRVKLEVFKTDKKGWAVRAGEPILRGTFICEYIGEVLDEEEANKRRDRYGKEGCSYMYTINGHANDMSRLIKGHGQYVLDATKYGNVSRFINHSCLPNLVNYQVLIESMDSMRAHIGLYASRDISVGEELTYDYLYQLLPGEGYPCYCGASKCRGRLY